MSSIESDLLVGFADILDVAGVADWRSSGAYQAGETAVLMGAMADTPDRVVVLAAYPVTDDPTLSDSVIGVQIRTRAGGSSPDGVQDLDSTIFGLLHGMPAQTINGVHIVQCFRQSGASLGQDHGRWTRTANYYVDVHRPSANRT